MNRINAKSARAELAYSLVCNLQQRFVTRLNQVSEKFGNGNGFAPTEWFRDQGQHGGGIRYMATDETVFNRASVNTSQVQYEDDVSKKLSSASAISTIIHPKNPLAASVHIHISWTEMKDHSGYWRVMADLNPSNENNADKEQFADKLRQSAPEQYEEAAAQGDSYFYIPVLARHRGVTHFYLENFSSGDFSKDLNMAKTVGETAIDTYCSLLLSALESHREATDEACKKQLDYHTLYFFQVLTLDRGTTSGLLVHNQNDIGILASLPSHINRALLVSWIQKLPAPQDHLLKNIVDCLPEMDICLVDDDTKLKLANCLRKHYVTHPKAINMQARGNVIPTTVNNHR